MFGRFCSLKKYKGRNKLTSTADFTRFSSVHFACPNVLIHSVIPSKVIFLLLPEVVEEVKKHI